MSEVNYIVVTHLLPQDATLEEWLYVSAEAFKQRQSIVFSADDAKRLVAAGLPGSQVIVWAANRWTSGDIAAWLGVVCDLRDFPADLPPTYSWYLYPNLSPYAAHNAIAVKHGATQQQDFSQPDR